MAGPEHLVVLSGLLFAVGMVGALARRNVVRVLLSLQVMLGAVSLALVALSRQHGDAEGQVVALLLALVGAAQGGAGVSLLVVWARGRARAGPADGSSFEC